MDCGPLLRTVTPVLAGNMYQLPVAMLSQLLVALDKQKVRAGELGGWLDVV